MHSKHYSILVYKIFLLVSSSSLDYVNFTYNYIMQIVFYVLCISLIINWSPVLLWQYSGPLEKLRHVELTTSKYVFSTFQLLQLVTDISSPLSHLFLVHRGKKDLQPCCLSTLTQTVNQANMSWRACSLTLLLRLNARFASSWQNLLWVKRNS